jgi:hypothetical protein
MRVSRVKSPSEFDSSRAALLPWTVSTFQVDGSCGRCPKSNFIASFIQQNSRLSSATSCTFFQHLHHLHIATPPRVLQDSNPIIITRIGLRAKLKECRYSLLIAGLCVSPLPSSKMQWRRSTAVARCVWIRTLLSSNLSVRDIKGGDVTIHNMRFKSTVWSLAFPASVLSCSCASNNILTTRVCRMEVFFVA